MPIPLLETPRETAPNSFQLVPSVAPGYPAALAARTVAYFFDLMVVAGVSLYASKLISLFLISLHMTAIRNSGRLANRVFQETLGQGQVWLGFMIFAAFYVAYFVGMARIAGKTLGLGLLGLRLEGMFGRPPLRSLWYRQLGCLLQFATGGLMHLQLLKGPHQPLLQDTLSATRVVSDR